jgi:hypothetical protein
VWLITQSREVGGGIGPLPSNLDPRQCHRPLPPRRGKVEVLLVRKVESFLNGEPGWLLRLRGGYAGEQN